MCNARGFFCLVIIRCMDCKMQVLQNANSKKCINLEGFICFISCMACALAPTESSTKFTLAEYCRLWQSKEKSNASHRLWLAIAGETVFSYHTRSYRPRTFKNPQVNCSNYCKTIRCSCTTPCWPWAASIGIKCSVTLRIFFNTVVWRLTRQIQKHLAYHVRLCLVIHTARFGKRRNLKIWLRLYWSLI